MRSVSDQFSYCITSQNSFLLVLYRLAPLLPQLDSPFTPKRIDTTPTTKSSCTTPSTFVHWSNTSHLSRNLIFSCHILRLIHLLPHHWLARRSGIPPFIQKREQEGVTEGIYLLWFIFPGAGIDRLKILSACVLALYHLLSCVFNFGPDLYDCVAKTKRWSFLVWLWSWVEHLGFWSIYACASACLSRCEELVPEKWKMLLMHGFDLFTTSFLAYLCDDSENECLALFLAPVTIS